MMTNLIYDRTLEDVAEVRRLLAKLNPETGDGLTAAEQAKWDAGLKGAYNFTDLNRVEAAVKQLAAALTSAGYPVEITPVLKGSSRLPAGYTEVEWIQSSGTQYIDIGFKPNQDTRIVIDFTALTTSANAYAYGMRGDSAHNTNPRFGAIFKNASVRVDYGNGNGVTLPLTLTVGGRYKLDQNKNTCALNASTATNSTATFQCPNPAYLFAINEGGTAKYFATIKFYSGQVYDNGALIRNFVPARNAAGTPGLYDTVNGVFYTNKGSGAFTAGADIVGFTAGADVSPYEDREWQEGDIVRRAQWATYLNNVQRLRDAYYTLAETGELPKPEDKLDYQGANTIEKILADIDLLIDCMKSSYRRCGTFRAGNNAAHLPLKGSA